MSAAVDRVARLGACALLRGLFLPGLLAAAVPAAPGAEATNRYEFREQHDPDGIGKFFLGREIAWVMGHEGADWLERPERDREEHTTDLVALLDLQPGQVVADIGAGTGYFTRQMAPRLGSSGKVLAVDVQPEMLRLLTNRLGKLGITNVVPILGATTNAHLPPASVDLALLVDVYHEFDFPFEMMQSIVGSLKPGGRVVLVEYRGEDPGVPIKPVHKMTEAQVRREMALHPLEWVQTHRSLPWQHAVVFRKSTERRGDCLVGACYFSGWWRAQPNKYTTDGRDWRAQWPGRVPLLGEYNEQDTLDREIAAAAGHGVSFFQFLWYPQGPKVAEPHADKLNAGLRCFLVSTNQNRMRFTLEYVNHPPFQIESDTAWDAACREWCDAMRHPRYLRVGGRPVFKVHGADYFLQQNGGSPERVEARLESLRRMALSAGLPRPLIGGGVMAGAVAQGPAIRPYDFLTTYMDIPALPQRAEPYPYETLLDLAKSAWENYGRCEKPYVPYLPAGWDPRPWKDPRPAFAAPDRAQWLAALTRVRNALESAPNLGVPVGDKLQRMVLVYAWNEFGEGGFVAPTRGEGYMKLECIREVFGTPAP